MPVVTPFISLFALLMHTQQHAWSIRISMHGMLDIYIFVMERRDSHEEIDYGVGRCHERLEYVK
jgi:hypothetical protein